MRRQMTEERRRLNKSTHNWSRIRYRKILLGHLDSRTGQYGYPRR